VSRSNRNPYNPARSTATNRIEREAEPDAASVAKFRNANQACYQQGRPLQRWWAKCPAFAAAVAHNI
jgi:hypothetical protein